MTADIEHLVRTAGIAAPVAFVVLYAAVTMALGPGSAPSIAAGALFGAAWGTALTVLGATVGASGAFLLARRIGRVPLRARTATRFERLDAWVSERGFLTVLYVRLVPLFPFSAVNYAFGITSVSPRAYVAATALGIVPGSFAFVAFGSSLANPGSSGFVAALAMVLAVAVAAPLAQRALRRPRRAAEEPVT